MTSAYRVGNLTFSYDREPVLMIDRMEIPAGEIVALIGPNGSGKTTLLHLLAFIEKPRSGSIQFFDKPATRETILEFRRRVGLLLQQPYLFDTSVLANIVWGLHVRGVSWRKSREKAMEALEKVGLKGFEQRNAKSLSGGESQRVGLARALALEPDVLLLDEPSSHMDKASVRLTEETFVEMNRNFKTTVIFTTHNPLRGHYPVHRVLHLFHGKLVHASPENLFKGLLTEGGTLFRTDTVSIYVSPAKAEGSYISVDPAQIVLSPGRPDQATINAFEGRIESLTDENGSIRVVVQAGERFEVLMSKEQWTGLGLALGHRIWVTLPPTAITVLA